MIKKASRILTLLLTFTLGVSLVFSGCGKKDDTAKSDTSTTSNESTKPGGPPKALSVSLYDRGGIPADEGSADNNRWTKWVKESMLKEYNVDVKYVVVPRWESIQKFNLLFSSGEGPDLIFEYDSSFRNQLYVNKQIMPLDDLINKNSTEYKNLVEKYPLIKKISTKDDGKMYDLCIALGANTNHHLWIRNDWLKKVNLAVPQTVEDLYKVAKAFTEKDPDGNGNKDTLAISYSFVTGHILNSIFQNVDWVLKDGKVAYGWEQWKSITEFNKKLYDEGLVDRDYATDKNGQKSQQDFINGKIGIYGVNGGTSAAGQAVFESLKKNNPNADVIAIALPKSQFGQFGPIISIPVQPIASVNSSAKNPDAAIKYMDFMSRESTYKMLTFGIDGIHSKPNAQGAMTVIDTDKFKKEVAYAGDLAMPASWALYKYYPFKFRLDMSNPIQKEYAEKIAIPGDEIYLSKTKSPLARITDESIYPTWPQDLIPASKTLLGSGGKLAEIHTKCIVSGTSYSVDQAVKDAQDAFTKGGGDKLVQFMNDWYQKNKDKVVLEKDIFESIEAMKVK